MPINLEKAGIEMAYDAGCVNRYQIEAVSREKIQNFLSKQDKEILSLADAWLGELSDLDFETVVSGDQDEAEVILSHAPIGVKELLDELYWAVIEEDEE